VAEMKYVRKIAGCTWTGYKTNIETAEELNITSALDKIQEYRRNLVVTCKKECLVIDYRV
jgi:hypothetical protein